MNINKSYIITLSFAIFSMFFGAGNLIYPLEVGIDSGQHLAIGMLGFLLTAVLLPFMGLLAMVLFDGDYNAFFNRLGTTAGQTIIALCMIIIGPVIAIPRIVTLSHVMIAPFIPWQFLQEIHTSSSFVFALLFLAITFIAAYRPSKIVDVIGNIITPALLISLIVIIIKGLLSVHAIAAVDMPLRTIFGINLLRGYETLDLIGSIFFSSIVINMIKSTLKHERQHSLIAMLCLKAGFIGLGLLSIIYIGMGLLGVYHGTSCMSANSGELFSKVSFCILGSYGALIIATAVLMACLSTAIALGAVIARYINVTVSRGSLSYTAGLLITLLSSIPLSTYGLSTILSLTGGPLVYIGYPVIIAITFCNIAYKLWGMQTIVLPVILTFFIALTTYLL
ncbi:MAG TPA: branched-chain amino acid transport system II carrier protein [Candidatus Babeliales bacterium]|jgi:LIVCS family branched-chain amino acid:cation transporter|nr:branched-chain amino acid transport system II carrier protein [Candidatus Babeliales bacterium]